MKYLFIILVQLKEKNDGKRVWYDVCFLSKGERRFWCPFITRDLIFFPLINLYIYMPKLKKKKSKQNKFNINLSKGLRKKSRIVFHILFVNKLES